jgi:hypothetical protein
MMTWPTEKLRGIANKTAEKLNEHRAELQALLAKVKADLEIADRAFESRRDVCAHNRWQASMPRLPCQIRAGIRACETRRFPPDRKLSVLPLQEDIRAGILKPEALRGSIATRGGLGREAD